MSKKNTVWVGNLSFRVKEEMLEAEFSKFGTVLSIDIPRYPDSGKPKGYAFIEYERAEDAEAAIQHQDGIIVDGRAINAEFAGKSKRGRKRGHDDSPRRSLSPDYRRKEDSRSISRSPSPSKRRKRTPIEFDTRSDRLKVERIDPSPPPVPIEETK